MMAIQWTGSEMGERPGRDYCIERYRKHLIKYADTSKEAQQYEDMSDWEIQELMYGQYENEEYDRYRDDHL